MPRIRLLVDVGGLRAGEEATVAPVLAKKLLKQGKAERVIERQAEPERAVTRRGLR